MEHRCRSFYLDDGGGSYEDLLGHYSERWCLSTKISSDVKTYMYLCASSMELNCFLLQIWPSNRRSDHSYARLLEISWVNSKWMRLIIAIVTRTQICLHCGDAYLLWKSIYHVLTRNNQSLQVKLPTISLECETAIHLNPIYDQAVQVWMGW